MHEAERDRFVEAAAAEDGRNLFAYVVVEAGFAFGNGSGRARRRDVFITVDAGYFFGDVRHFRAVAAITGNDGRQGIAVFFNAELQRFQDMDHVGFRDFRAQEFVDLSRRKGDARRSLRFRIDIDDALGYVAGAHFLEELGTAVDGFDATVRIEASFKTAGSFGTQAEHTARMTDVGAFEGSTFEDDRRRLVRDFRIHAAHDAGDAAGFFFIGDDQHVVGQFAVYIVQSLQGFIGFGPAGDEVMAGDFIVVIGMEWDAQFDHGVVGSVDDVVDGTDAGLAQALLHPHRRLADLDVQEQAGGIAAAQFFIVNGYFDLAVDGRVTFFDGNIRVTGFFAAEDGEFTGQADHGEAVGAIGRQFIFIDDVADLEIVGRIDAEGRIGRQNPNAFPFFRQEQTVVEAEFVGRAEHAVGQDAAQLRALDLGAARQMSAVDGDGDDLADADVGRSRDDLKLFIPHVYLADDEFIRIGVLVDLKDFPGLYFLDFCPPVFHLFDRDTGNGQFIGKCLHVLVHVDVDIILHPS